MVEHVHGTAIASGGYAALIRGPSGAGKSDLALRCLALPPSPFLAEPMGLVADDQVVTARRGDRIVVSAPATIRNMIEVRGIGVVPVSAVQEATLALVVDLVAAHEVERMPEPMPPLVLDGIDVPVIRLDPYEMSAPIKVAIALARAIAGARAAG